MKSKNIVVLSGSPRKNGNTALLVNSFIEGAKESGYTVTKFETASMQIKGCTGCYYCRTHDGKCRLKDDMEQIYHALYQCDVLVLASPIYYFSFTAQLKLVIDRFEAGTGRRFPIKECILLTTYYQPENSGTLESFVQQYHMIAHARGWRDKGVISAANMESPGDIRDHSSLYEARRLGQLL